MVAYSRITELKINSMTHAIRRLQTIATVLASVLVVSGCAESSLQEATGKGRIRGINSIATSPELTFKIEERGIGSVNYRAVAGFAAWDDLNYNFNFDLLLPGALNEDRIASQIVDVFADIEYTLVLTGTLDNPSVLVWEQAEREWDGTETVFEVDFVNLSPLLGQVDVYFAIEGTLPVAGNQVGTLSNGERQPYLEFPEGDYEIIVTAPGDPATVIFQSTGIPRLPAVRVTVALFDPDPSIVAAIGVNIISDGGSSQNLSDINTPPQVRTMHTAFGTVNFDGFFNNDFNNVIFPNVGFGEISPYVDLTEILTPLTLTPVGNIGAPLIEDEIQFITNIRRTIFLYGQPAELFTRKLPHTGRQLSTFPVMRITDLSSNTSLLDVYDVEAGTVLDDTVIPRFAGMITGLSTSFFDSSAGMREFVITLSGEKTPIATPLVLDLANCNLIDMVIVDTVDPTVVELQVFDSVL